MDINKFLTPCPFSKITIEGSFPFLFCFTRFIGSGVNSFLCNRLQIQSKAVGLFHSSHGTIVLVDTSCLLGQYHGMQGLLLGQPIDSPSLPAACIAPSSREEFSGQFQISLCSKRKCMVSSALGLTF